MMDSGTEVSTIHHRDIHNYYLALQKYFNDAETKHDRSNSPRAQKARAKLLKLSASQFYELSTDVYDELQRRINEDESQPEYLLPKATFHMKRNQARQKLANLSNTRFNDLVDDILFEIKRRGYNGPPDPDVTESRSTRSAAATGASTPKTKKSSSGPLKPSDSDGSNSQIPPTPTATIQTSKVIPQKASIDWSSDDDEHDTEQNTNTNYNTNNTHNTNNTNNTNKDDSHSEKSRDLRSGKVTPPPDINALHQPNTTPLLNSTDSYHHYGDVFDSPALTEPGNNQRGDETLTGNGANNRDSSTFDFEGFSKGESNHSRSIQPSVEPQNQEQIDQLQSEIEALKKENVSLRQPGNPKGVTSSEHFQKDLSSINAEVGSLSVENEQLKAKISELEFKAKTSEPQQHPSSLSSTSSSKNELEKLALDRESVTRYTAQDGSIPFESVEAFHQYIKKLFTDLQTDVDDIGRTLFEDLSRLSHTVAQLFILVDVPDFKEEVILLKASLSHTITAIRYFAVYGALLPKITVQAAISELAFAFCNLVRSCKIKGDGRGGAALGRSKISSDNDSSALDPQTPSHDSIPNTKFENPFNHPTVVTKFDDDFGHDEMSPVKPLKITQKAGMSPSAKTPLSARKQSSGLPFRPMVDTKSPASHGKGNSAGLPFEKTKELNETSPTSVQSDSSDSGSLTTKIKEPSQGKGIQIKNFETAKDSSNKYDPNNTLNGDSTPERSTATSKAATAEGTTTLPTPLSTASSSVNEPKKVREDPVGEPKSGPHLADHLPITADKKGDSYNPKNLGNEPKMSDELYYPGDEKSRDLQERVSGNNIFNNPIKPTKISEDLNNKDVPSGPMKNSSSPNSTNPFRNVGSPAEMGKESFDSIAGEENRRNLKSDEPKNDRTPQQSTKNGESVSPQRVNKTPEAIKDAISRLEGKQVPESQDERKSNSPINPTRTRPQENETQHKALREEDALNEQPQLSQPQEENLKKDTGKSFTEKLRTFATNAGIGLRADKDQKDKLPTVSQSKGLDSNRISDDKKRAATVSADEENAPPGNGSGTPPADKTNGIDDSKKSNTFPAHTEEPRDVPGAPKNLNSHYMRNAPAVNKELDGSSYVSPLKISNAGGPDTDHTKKTNGLPFEELHDRGRGKSNGLNFEQDEISSRYKNSTSTADEKDHGNDEGSGIMHIDDGPVPLNTKENPNTVTDPKDASLKSARSNDVNHSGFPSTNSTPFVTLNDGNKETDITPRGQSKSFESKAADQDKEVSSKLPNFYFNNIPKPPPTNPNLTDKLKKTFADFPSEDENEEGSDLNNSPYMSDDGSVFGAFKQSWREEDGGIRGSPLIQQQNIYGNNSELGEKPAGLGLSENTHLKFNKEPNGIPPAPANRSNPEFAPKREDRDLNRQKKSSHGINEFSPNEKNTRTLPQQHDSNEDSHRKGRDSEGFGHVDDSMMNPGEYLKQQNKVGAGYSGSQNTSESDPLHLKQNPQGKYDDAHRRWDSTDEEDEDGADSYKDAFVESRSDHIEQTSNSNQSKQKGVNDIRDEDDAGSYKDAFVGNRLDHLEQTSNSNQLKQKGVNKLKENTSPDNNSFPFKNNDESSRKNPYHQGKGYDKRGSPTFPDTPEERNEMHAPTISSIESTEDLNADPSFADDIEFVDAPGSKPDYYSAPQLQPVKLFSSNTQSRNQERDISNNHSDEKPELHQRDDDISKSRNAPKTPVMKNSTFRPQGMKTPSGKSPSIRSPATKSPGTRSLASNKTDDGEYTFDVDAFDIENPDNTLSELLLYLEHQSLQVIATIQSLLTSIKEPHATKGNLRKESNAINQVIRQMVDATSVSMNQSRNASLKEHGSWVVKSLEDCYLRMTTLCQLNRDGEFSDKPGDEDYADKHFKQRLAGIAFDIAKCTKELVKTVEEASLKEEIEFLNSRLN